MTDMLEDGPQEESGQRARSGRRRLRLPAALVAAAALAAVVLFWFQPQKLFLDERVDEDVPLSASGSAEAPPAAESSTTAVDAPAGPVELGRGEFVSLDHGTRGVARVLELGADERIVRFEGLDTDNGPDLYVYLTANPADGDEGAFDDTFVNLGRLKGNQGDQNYDIPPGTDLRRFPTIVIWCDRFDSAFGAADLTPT